MLVFEKYYHIYNHANGDENLFREQKNYEYFLEKYNQHINPIAETIAWCLIPNHFHLLVKIRTENEIASTFPKFETLEKFEDKTNFLSKQFANFFSSYTQSFNKIYERRGSLFLKNFKRKEIIDENYFRNLILYIHLNPLKHGFTDDILGWKWNSYQSFPTTHQEILDMLFDDNETYQYIHRQKQSYFGEYENLENELT